MAGDPTLRDQFRLKGLDHAEHFDWRKTAAETLEVYERAIAHVPSRRNSMDRWPQKTREFQATVSRQ